MSKHSITEIRDRIRELRRVPASQLIPNLKNWRRHPPKQRKAMQAVLQEVGYADALLARQDENGQLILIDGHLRADVTPNQDIPVLILDVTAAEADKILATLDPLASMAELDNAAWTALIDGIDADLPDFRDLLAELNPQTDVFRGLTDEDAIPEPPTKPISVPSDVWLLGKHRLGCGDSSNLDDVQRIMGGQLADLVFTDPPYNVAYSGRGEVNALGPIQNDDMSDSEFDAFISRVFSCCCSVMKDLAPIYVAHPDSKSAPKITFEKHFARWFHKAATIIWLKQSAGMGWQDYRAQHEPILYGWKQGEGSHYFIDDRSKTTVWDIARDAQSTYRHPTQKPVALSQEAIQNSTRPGASVLDPFAGSGSTLIACEKTGRVARVLELDPKYCDVIIRRWQSFTGGVATLASNGLTFDQIAGHRRSATQVEDN